MFRRTTVTTATAASATTTATTATATATPGTTTYTKKKTAYQGRLRAEKAGVDLVERLPTDVPVAIPVHPCEDVAANPELPERVEDTPKRAVIDNTDRCM